MDGYGGPRVQPWRVANVAPGLPGNHRPENPQSIPPSDGPRRFPHHQVSRNGVVSLRSIFLSDESLERSKSSNRQLGAGQDYGGQWRLRPMREGNIVKTDQRYIVGDP